jgi:hypothetical protein
MPDPKSSQKKLGDLSLEDAILLTSIKTSAVDFEKPQGRMYKGVLNFMNIKKQSGHLVPSSRH